MDSKAFEQACRRLALAERAYHELLDSTSFAATEDAWSSFLAAASTIYSKLEQGSKSNGPSQAWFGRKKRERKTDELLSYIHHARNSDEHGIQDVTRRTSGGYSITGNGGKFQAQGLGGPLADLIITPVEGPPPTVRAVPPSVTLSPVKDDRYGDIFHPPREHLGKPLERVTINIVAGLAITYLHLLLKEAEQLVRSP